MTNRILSPGTHTLDHRRLRGRKRVTHPLQWARAAMSRGDTRSRLAVIEPRDDEGDLLCYQDHWYRSESGRLTETLTDPPSLRAHENAGRVRNDLGTGGFMNVQIEPLVVLTRGRPDDVRSSSVPFIAGLDPLVRHILSRRVSSTDRVRTLALAAALARNITLTGV